MITLNDYLYSGDTLLRILKKYIRDLRIEAKEKHNEIDLVHCNFLIQIQELLEHNDFLTAQSQKIREFYKYMAGEYPFLAFTFKGRIKSLIRAEEKFNGYVVEFIYDYYKEYGEYPSVSQIKERLSCFRDFIAYRIVIAMPRCHLKNGENVREVIFMRSPIYFRDFWKKEDLPQSRPEECRKVHRHCSAEKQSLTIGITSVITVRMIISLCISRFMITVPEAIWKYSCGPKKWMMLRRLVPPTI